MIQGKSGMTPGLGQSGKSTVVLVVLLMAAVLGGGIAYQKGWFHSPHAENAVSRLVEKYTCGMHPWIITDKPGDCPICGMKLTKIEETPVAAPAGQAAPQAQKTTASADDFFADIATTPKERKLLFYRNPMNPVITSAAPMKDEMGMDYVPVYEDEVQPAGPGGPVEGRVTVRIPAESLKAAGVQTAPAEFSRLQRTVRTVGIVTPDETLIRHVHTKIDGWVEGLQVNFRGQVVEKGQPILSFYSPTLLASQEEYLQARETAQKFATNPDVALQKLGKQLFDSAKQRLELYDVPERFLAELERTGKVRRTVLLNAPVAGFVTAKAIFEGQKIEPGMELYTITDLSQVWIEADLYEYEVKEVRIGQEATLTLPYDSAVRLAGRVAYVNPFLTPESRTLKVRFAFANPDLVLKPAMYADVTLALAIAEGVVIPDSAVMDTGTRKLVFVRIAPETFEPRTIEEGIRGDGRVQVMAGVRAGEEVVVKANFLIDSESRLRAAMTQQSQGGGGH